VIFYAWESEENKQRVRELSDRLRGDHIDCQIDQYEIPPQGLNQWIREKIADKDCFILIVCTEAYREAIDTPGRVAAFEYDQVCSEIRKNGQRSRFISLVFTPADSRFIPPEIASCNVYCLAICDLASDPGYQSLLGHLKGETKPPPLGPTELAGREMLWWTHSPNRYFMGREEQLQKIEVGLRKHSAVVLTGLSGIGKTSLCIAYADQHRGEYEWALYLNADREADIRDGFAKIAAAVGIRVSVSSGPAGPCAPCWPRFQRSPILKTGIDAKPGCRMPRPRFAICMRSAPPRKRWIGALTKWMARAHGARRWMSRRMRIWRRPRRMQRSRLRRM
jgi:hypothetical protein